MSGFKQVALATALVLFGSHAVHAQSIVKVDGSSTVFPITEAVAEDIQKARKGSVKVTVGISGTGGGFKKFCRGEIDVSGASRPILKKEMEACASAGIRYYELPVAFDALTVIVNPKNTFVKQLTVEQLKKMWEPDAQGKVTSWKQIDSSFPDVPLKLFGAGSDSGTFDYFTEAVVGKAKASRGDFTASEDDNVLVQGVSRDQNAIGYFGYAYYAENQGKLKAVPIVNKEGKAVSPGPDSVISGAYNPLSRPIFIYVSEKSLEKPEVRDFVAYYMKNASDLATEVKYVPLPPKAYETAMENVNKKKVGTVFGGEAEVGVTIESLLSREAKL
ncbi:PstS family phosphate ABC transporter substrate-binding protein [Aromatoleum aromaticum]|uniref:Phosphate-binding protein n=1 Tax=Aromatoleum aromaticum (strain DSM 19018 / LMG 30748 / EbN1) TaxID=76114 RepID=Q5P1F6_AROAE|nr:PstS family phosphate ABC transporter substrate-binding protein [Aromatoleum aromaticum]NMG53203.1 phosphate ABC transporter substrate-binding protein PstS family protein [Aromatoleum aromaticum]CAI08858.1 Phosphate ABC transporter, periplasmic phosphate-binding protein [Aromatoleum aromaticum EbN1]